MLGEKLLEGRGRHKLNIARRRVFQVEFESTQIGDIFSEFFQLRVRHLSLALGTLVTAVEGIAQLLKLGQELLLGRRHNTAIHLTLLRQL